MKLPDLGIGFVYLPGLEAFLESIAAHLDLVEVEPQTFWTAAAAEEEGGLPPFRADVRALARAAGLGCPALVHSVGYPVGGSRDGDARNLAALRETFSYLRPHWWSEHASFVSAFHGDEERHIGFLMPPLQRRGSVAVIADRIKRLQDEFGIPFAFETGVNYLSPSRDELPDGLFWSEIAERANCGILLDLHNVWTNEVNGRQPVELLVEQLPLERVWEIHVAGGQWHKGYWLDSHSGLPPSTVMQAAADLVPRLPALHALVLEIIPEHLGASTLSAADVAGCLSELRAIWATRGRTARASASRSVESAGIGAVMSNTEMAEWERSLEDAVRSMPGRTSPGADESGVEIYRDLIAMARRGTVVDALPLSARYLYDELGEGALNELFSRFWASSPPRPFMSDEAGRFAEFVRIEPILPHLDEVVAFELAAHRAAMTGSPQIVRFSCEPAPLLRSLREGRPPQITPAEVELEVTPPRGA